MSIYIFEKELAKPYCQAEFYKQLARLKRLTALLKDTTQPRSSRLRCTSDLYTTELVAELYESALSQLEDEMRYLYEHQDEVVEMLSKKMVTEFEKREAYYAE